MCHSNYNIQTLAQWKFQGALNELQGNSTSVLLFLFCYLKGSGFDSSFFCAHTPTRTAVIHIEPEGLYPKRNALVKGKPSLLKPQNKEHSGSATTRTSLLIKHLTLLGLNLYIEGRRWRLMACKFPSASQSNLGSAGAHTRLGMKETAFQSCLA